MNKPTLNILGRKRNIVAVVVENENGEQQHIYDQDTFGFMDDVANLAEVIENPGNTQKFIERLENTIKESHDYLNDLKNQIAENVLAKRSGLNESLVKEYKAQVSFIEGLKLSLDIAKGGGSWDIKEAVSEVSSIEWVRL